MLRHNDNTSHRIKKTIKEKREQSILQYTKNIEISRNAKLYF